jgi:hypothetical protein
MSRRWKPQQTNNEQLRMAIVHLLHGREETVSYLVDLIRQSGHDFPAKQKAACEKFRQLGFRLREKREGSVVRVFVGVPSDDHEASRSAEIPEAIRDQNIGNR